MPLYLPSGFATRLASGKCSLSKALQIVPTAPSTAPTVGLTSATAGCTLGDLVIPLAFNYVAPPAFFDGQTLGASSAPSGNFTVPGCAYSGKSALIVSNLETSSDPSHVNNLEVAFTLGPDITKAAVEKGLYERAKFYLLMYDRSNLDYQALLLRGTLGAITVAGLRCQIKLRSLEQALTATILPPATALSRWRWYNPDGTLATIFGASYVNFDPATGTTQDSFAATLTTTITSVDSSYPRRRFTLSAAAGFPAGRFSGGTVQWTSGANSGYIGDVMEFDAGTGVFTMSATNTPYPISAGDGVKAMMGVPLTIEEWILVFGSAQYLGACPGISTIEQASTVILT